MGSPHLKHAIAVTRPLVKTDSLHCTMAYLILATLALLAGAAHGFGFGVPTHGMSPYGGMGGMGGGFPQMGGMGGGMGGFDRGYREQEQRRPAPEFLTCISKDDDDQTSQIRLTLTRNRRGAGRMQGPMMGGPMMGGPMGGLDGFDDDDDENDEFRVDGTFVPGMGANKAGPYRVVITQFGRVSDGCSAQSLGPVLQYDPSRNRRGGMGMHGGMGMGMPGFGGMHGGMMGMGGFRPPMNKMGQKFWLAGQGGSPRAEGEMHNAAIIGSSATVFSDHVQGISKNNLVGRGIALARVTRDGMIMGRIPYCCTIGRDNLPAMEMAVTRGRGGMNGAIGIDDFDDFDGTMVIGAPMGGNLGGGNIVGGGNVGFSTDDGLF